MNRMLYMASGLEVRERPDGTPGRTITGYAILFDTPSAVLYEDEEDEVREVIASGAVTRELLDGCDIKMTMFHDRQLILARSRNGEGTLSYSVDDRGVRFEFEAPATADGDKALELVRRGDISGCSFAFSTCYYDRGCVSRDVVREGGKSRITYTVRTITNVYDFTLAADPAYPDTSCEAEARGLFGGLCGEDTAAAAAARAAADRRREQIGEMRRAAAKKSEIY